MFKVMIADDEIYVVALIKKLVDWEKFQMEVAGTANDGISALQMVTEINPDLIIVDIRMPGYDGIEFMDQVRAFNSQVRFIVISGHKQFDYAKGAMRNNVEDYLLKPINKEELEQVIEQVYHKLKEHEQTEFKLKEMEEELDSSKKRIRELLVDEAVNGTLQAETEPSEQINSRYLTDFGPGCYQLAALILDAPSVSGDQDLMLRESCRQLRKKLQPCCADVLDLTTANKIFWLINYPPEWKAEVRAAFQRQLTECEQRVKKFENLYFRICLSNVCNEFTSLAACSSSLWDCIIARTAIARGKIIECDDLKESDIFLKAVLENRGEQLEQALRRLDMTAISRAIREMYSKAFYGIEEDSRLYYKLYCELSERIYRYFQNIGVCREEQQSYFQRLRRDYLDAAVPSEYSRILCRECERLIHDNQLSEQRQAAPAIRIVKRYISEHYREDISLSVLAEMVNISPVYLSRLFKKEEGINFLDYLNQYRIEIAKGLLKEISYNVLDVAVLSGFRNNKYFSKIFKKSVGITPSEYRKRHLEVKS